jgi:PEP-CTERM motif
MINQISKLIPLIAVGLLMANRLPAQVLYSGDKNIAFGTSYGIPDPFTFTTASNTFKIDFDADGVADIAMFRYIFTFPTVAIGGLNGGQFSATIGAPAAPRVAGASIDSTGTWSGGSSWGDLNFATGFPPLSTGHGPYFNQRGFIGARFPLLDGLHYGWIDYASDNTGTSGTVFGWAWEKTPDAAIIAGDRGPGAVPEPSTYALSGAAALGLIIIARRRRR